MRGKDRAAGLQAESVVKTIVPLSLSRFSLNSWMGLSLARACSRWFIKRGPGNTRGPMRGRKKLSHAWVKHLTNGNTWQIIKHISKGGHFDKKVTSPCKRLNITVVALLVTFISSCFDESKVKDSCLKCYQSNLLYVEHHKPRAHTKKTKNQQQKKNH